MLQASSSWSKAKWESITRCLANLRSYNITVAYKGRLAIRLTCDVGDSAHASAPWLAKNSIEEMYDFWNAIKTEISKKALRRVTLSRLS